MPGVASIYGPLLIGVFFNAILFGVLVMQVHVYYQTYKKSDPLWIRSLVLFLLLLETINTGLDISIVWEPLIEENGSFRALQVSPWALRTDPIVTAIISTVVQLFFAWRIRRLTGSTVLASPIIFLAFCSLVGGTVSTTFVSLSPEFSSFATFQWALLTWLICSALCDMVITVSLVVHLVRNKGNFAATDSVLNKIVMLTVQTNGITFIAALTDVLVFMLLPGTTLQFIWDLSLCKLYSNSLISTLNARANWNHILSSDGQEISFCHIEELGEMNFVNIQVTTTTSNAENFLSCNPDLSRKNNITKPYTHSASSSQSYTSEKGSRFSDYRRTVLPLNLISDPQEPQKAARNTQRWRDSSDSESVLDISAKHIA